MFEKVCFIYITLQLLFTLQKIAFCFATSHYDYFVIILYK